MFSSCYTLSPYSITRNSSLASDRFQVLFNSFVFLLIFLPLVAGVHALLRDKVGWPWSQAWLLIASLFFYGYAKPAYLPLLLSSILFNWGIARLMCAQNDLGKRKIFLWTGLTVDIAVLFLFKYVDIFLSTVAWFHGPRLAFPNWGFPLGVSFYTLTQIMYLVDAFPRPPTTPAARAIYRGLMGPNSLFDHATFVALFPYVTSGPLVRARLVLPQLKAYSMSEQPLSLACRGVYLFAIGLSKKLILADAFGPIADAGFSSISQLSTVEAWISCLAALLHVYFDFSGYSDMAVGAAWMLGIDIPQNFDAPFRSRSIFEFWQRWHISLSNFITDYLFKPMLRSMGSPTLATSAVATILAMTIAALWHGPTWTFVAWGLCHGSALAAHQVWKKHKLQMPDWLGRVITMLFLTTTVVFLRTPYLGTAAEMVGKLIPHRRLLGLSVLQLQLPQSRLDFLHPVLIGLIAAFFFKSSAQYAKEFRPSLRNAFAAATLILVGLLLINSAPAKQFVYFGF
jgi:alginate O-acetyltransferase complex protein AlgI